MTPDTPQTSPPSPRLRAWIACALPAACACMATVFCIWSMHSIGLTGRESDLLALAGHAGDTAPAAVPGTPQACTLAKCILFCSTLGGSASVTWRWLFHAINVWNLLLLVSIARRTAIPRAAAWACVLGVPCAQWLMGSACIDPAVVATWGILIVQWAFGRLWQEATPARTCVYVGALAAALYATPFAAPVVAVHGIWLFAASVAALRKRDQHAHAAFMVAVSTACLLAVVCTVVCSAVVTVSLPGMSDARQWWFEAWQAGVESVASFTGPWGESFRAAGMWRVAAIAAGCAALAALAALRSSEVGVLFACIVLYLPLWRILAGLPGRCTAFALSAHLWPFIVLVCAIGAATLHNAVRGLARRLPLPARVMRWVIAGAATAIAGSWVWVHVPLCAVALGVIATDDLAAPARFIAATARPQDTVAILTDADPRLERQMRPYVAALDAWQCTATFATVAAGIWPTLMTPTTGMSNHLFLVGALPPPTAPGAPGYTNMVFPFTLAASAVLPTSTWPHVEALHLWRQALRAAPFSPAITEGLIDWYRAADDATLQQALRTGWVQGDLALPCVSHTLRVKLRGAQSRVLYAWSDFCLDNRAEACIAYNEFDGFIRAVRRADIDRERAVYVYRLCIEHALLSSNMVLATAMLRDARSFDRTEPHLDRLEAQLSAMQSPEDTERVKHLNARADKRFRARHGRAFVEAMFANALIERHQGRDMEAIAQCEAVLADIQEYRQRTNIASSTEVGTSDSILDTMLFWEAQCNSYIALMCLAQGDANMAIEWQKKNLDPRFDALRQRVAQERLAHMHVEAGDLKKAVARLEKIADESRAVSQRVFWVLQAAQLNVTYGEAVAAYDQLTTINGLVAELSPEERLEWSRNKQYQRLIRYVERRLNVDMRDAVTTALRTRAEKDPIRRAWYFRQIAQIERCRLQYNRAEDAFNAAMRASPGDPDTSLDAAMLEYRRLRYAQARTIMSNAMARTSAKEWKEYDADWRYRVLSGFMTLGRPPAIDALLGWGDANLAASDRTAARHRYRAHIFSVNDQFDAATNEFALAIAADPESVDVHLDAGALLCTRANADEAGNLLDTIIALPLIDDERKRLEGDWRIVELYHVSIRPYAL